MRRYIITFVLAFAAPAHADPEPWKVGVTAAQMQKAQKLLEEGNVLLLERDYANALAKYTEAIASWDHPAIRFNMVRCQIQLGRLIEASDNLDKALQYGAAPLEESVYNEALSYKTLFATQIATLEVRCEQPGVAIALDGKPILQCPGKVSQRVMPGQHQLVGKRDGFLTRTVDVVTIGGKTSDVSMSLEELVVTTKKGKLTHRWPTWAPWVVVGGGVAVLGGGILVQRMAMSDRDAYHATLRDCEMELMMACEGNVGQDKRDLAVLENRIAIGTIIIGSAAIVTGGVLVYLNRGRLVYEDTIPNVTLRPDGASVGVTGRF